MRRLIVLSRLAAVATIALVLGLIATASVSHAYEFSGGGGKLGFSNPDDRDGTAEVGLHAEFEQTGTRVHLQPNLMYWKVNGTRDLAPNMDVYYHFEREGRVNFIHQERLDRSNTDLGMNMIGGLRFPGEGNQYFLESRFTASDINQVSVLGGITFHAR
jgi:hypothetical protein